MPLTWVVLPVVISGLLTGWIRHYAQRHRLIDVPNARSSHVLPTPRGGGGAIVLVVLSALPLFAWHGAISSASLNALWGAGLLVAGIGWLDDHGEVAPRWRLLVHLCAAVWALGWLGGLPPIPVFGVSVDAGWLGDGIAVLYLIWLVNLYNFMDGIDGMAAIEGITVCLGGLLLYRLTASGAEAWATPTLVAGAVGGFLLWNFPRARIFMGDVGSGFLGILLGLLSLQAGAVRPELFWGWLILLGAFVVDATLTLLRRFFRGERIYEAHRTHAYQHVARRLGSHVPVSLAVGAVNVLWLMPIAAVVATGRLDGLAGALLAYSPLVLLALRYGAGEPAAEA